MIRHQAIGGDPYPGLGMGLGQNLLEGDVVRRLLKQREPPDTTVEDMIRKISSCKAGAAGHTALVSIPETRVKKRLPTPFIRPPTRNSSSPISAAPTIARETRDMREMRDAKFEVLGSTF
jgi:hypothetical protein